MAQDGQRISLRPPNPQAPRQPADPEVRASPQIPSRCQEGTEPQGLQSEAGRKIKSHVEDEVFNPIDEAFYNFKTENMNFNFMKNFEISNLEAENKQSIYYSNLSNLSSISNISNISLISDTPLSDNIDPLDLSINSNIASIPSPSHVESKVDPMDPYVYKSKYKSKSKSSDASRVSKINIPIESSKEEYMSETKVKVKV